MSNPIIVQIVGVPIACAEGGVKDSWRELARWAAAQLQTRFDDSVRVEYYDLLDPTCPQLPIDAQLPFVLVNGEALSSGEKLSMPNIRKRIETLVMTEQS